MKEEISLAEWEQRILERLRRYPDGVSISKLEQRLCKGINARFRGAAWRLRKAGKIEVTQENKILLRPAIYKPDAPRLRIVTGEEYSSPLET